jgi:hypothetical protein
MTRAGQAKGRTGTWRQAMVTADPIAAADYPAHVETYRNFLLGIRLAVTAIAVLLVLLAFVLI